MKKKHETKITPEEIEEFGLRLTRGEKSGATVAKYKRDMRALMEYASGRALTKEILLGFKQSLIERGYSARSVNSMLSSINAYLRAVERTDLYVRQLKVQRQIYRPEEKELTKAEYERLVRAAKSRKNGRLSLMLETICATGIRVSELRYITVEAVKRTEAAVSCKAKTRTVFIVKELQKKLLKYCRERNITSGSIFVTKSGAPISRVSVWREMKSLCVDADVNPGKVFPHNLRHLFARAFYGIEKDIVKLADILGHSSIDTTRIYIISTGREHRRKMENLRLII